MTAILAVLAVLSIWDYPARFPEHDRLRRQFVTALREGDTTTMEESCRKGVKLLPDDPTWHYNLACSLAYFPKREAESLNELELAIDLGFRDVDAIRNDTDLKRLSKNPRLTELIEYADYMKSRPLMTGPLVCVDATGVMGKSISLGEQNLSWDFDVGCFVAHIKLAETAAGGNAGDLYMNRDGAHSVLNAAQYPGLTVVKLDSEGHERGMDMTFPNMLFPYPVFGNCSRAFMHEIYWRSIPRSMTTLNASLLASMVRFYLSNQTWVYPANADISPVGTNGDVFASITPYWLTTAGRSFSDLPYLRGALDASKSFKSATKKELVRQGLLAPTIQTLIRKSLCSVSNDVDYLSPKAHPTALPQGGLDVRRLVAAAAAMTPAEIPPLAVLNVKAAPVKSESNWPELTYASAMAWAYVLRSDDVVRVFEISAKGAKEFAFVQTHGEGVDVKIETLKPDVARVTINRTGMNPTNRVDVAVFGRNPGTGWGAPSYVSFARMDSKAPYSDPALTILEQPVTK